ncbi:MAG: DUF2442 domain-containing protein [Prevotellaceae bacterium]|nr:DUF2442 domain-containing protein [Prevotellaceae bacterium]
MEELRIIKVWVDEKRIYAEASNGEVAHYDFTSWPRLAKATQSQRRDFRLTYFGIHWPQIDEDLSFEGLFSDNGLRSDVVCEDNTINNK